LAGTLYIVSTPIGNLDDITFRAISTLKEVDLIAAEDTRVTRKILNKFNIEKKCISYNNYNENTKYKYIISLLKENLNIALVSDAGSPCISDPGYKLVNVARLEMIDVISIPGASSVIAALSISGLPTDKFYFEGFLPKKKGKNRRLDYIAKLDCSIIIFESPNRIKKTLKNIFKKLGNRVIAICKELTKLHENVKFGYLEDILLDIPDNNKGEYVIVIANRKYEIEK